MTAAARPQYADAEIRSEPELNRVIAWLDQEADQALALVSHLEDALSPLLMPTDEEGDKLSDDVPGFRSPVARNLGSIAARQDRANGRLAELVERLRAVIV